MSSSRHEAVDMLRAIFLVTFMATLKPIHTGFLDGSHPCNRICRWGSTRTCEYTFIIEDYQTMTSQCGHCPRHESECSNTGCIPADGWKRDVTVINRQLPSPDIQVCLGDRVKVTVINKLVESTSIHWHGQHQRKTPDMDGLPMVTQCPIESGTKFVYDFKAEQAGTMFYHSHTGFQKEDGVFGPFVVREGNDPLKSCYDEDMFQHVMIINDWAHIRTYTQYSETLREKPNVPPLGMLINGKGSFSIPGTVYETPLAEFHVLRGRRYRFRVIGSGAFACPIRVSIDDHQLNIIAVDGYPVKPTYVVSFVINTGERYDFVPRHVNNNPSGNYWIKSQGLMACENTTYQYGVLRYNWGFGIPSQQRSYQNAAPSVHAHPALSLNEPFRKTYTGTIRSGILLVSDLKSLKDEDDPTLKYRHVHRIYLFTGHKLVQEKLTDPLYPLKTLRIPRNTDSMWTLPFNNISFRYPTYPLLTQSQYYDRNSFCRDSLYGRKSCATEYCECPHLIKLPYNEVIELVIADLGVPFAASHPMHIHGYAPRVVAMKRLGAETTVEEVKRAVENMEYNGEKNLKNPPYKDTLTTPDGGFIIFRFYADNPGFWFMHCHISVHLHIGMAVIFQVGEYRDIYKDRSIPTTTCGHREPLTEESYILG